MVDEIHIHGKRAASLSIQLCMQLALPPHQIPLIAEAALKHDIGKYLLPAAILNKPFALTPQERQIVELHCLLGAGTLMIEAPFDTMASSTVTVAVALSHHEWWNGQGYPFGLSQKAIPQCARIVAVADVFDALVSPRPYKVAWTVAAAIEYIVEKRGSQFDPECVDALVAVAPRLSKIGQSATSGVPVSPFRGEPASRT